MAVSQIRMRLSHRTIILLSLAALSFTAGFSPGVARDREAPIIVTTPESVGMSSARLEKITAAFNKEVADKRVPGVVVMVSRKGKLVYSRAFGLRDPNANDPMQVDTIFRAYSMTKPFVAVGAMILVEDGVLQLTDPVAKWLPAFKDLKVSTPSGDVAPDRPMMVRDLLRHTAGLAYGELTQNKAVKDALAEAGLFKPGVINFDARDMTGAEEVDRLSKIPLIYQPGTTWEYSLATDVLGRVIESASGKRLGDFLALRLFGPLNMSDTAFWVTEAQQKRLAESYDKDPGSGTPIKLIDVSKQPGNDSGGGGSVSTAGDYLRFAQMMKNGGELEGTRILSRTTIKLMTTDQLGQRIPIASTPGGSVLGASGYTWGLGLAVRPSDGANALPGSAGDFNWGGYAGTAFWVDPKEELVAVMMVQETPASGGYHGRLLRQLVYQAITD
jgi:CubicO group peptidase (beta-lactamase class C family)